MAEFNPEINRPTESESPIVLSIVPPDDIRGWRIEFTAATKDEAWAYNAAIRKTMHGAKLIPYETTGQDNEPNNEPGRHSWEANPSHRARVTTAEQLTELLPEINRQAQEYLDGRN